MPQKIAGNLPYIPNYGTIRKVLDKVVTAAKPDRLTQDYLANVFGLSGGNYRAVLPILKRTGLLASDGTPTETYSKFRTEAGRAEAAFLALKTGFPELFKRSEHVYAAPDAKLTDLIVEITGLTKDDGIVRAIRGTFKVFSSFLPQGFSSAGVGSKPAPEESEPESELPPVQNGQMSISTVGAFGLAYHINIVLPESTNPDVYNAIFKSLRENLLRQ